MMDYDDIVPTRYELASLTPRGMLAYVVRAVRRIQPFYVLPQHEIKRVQCVQVTNELLNRAEFCTQMEKDLFLRLHPNRNIPSYVPSLYSLSFIYLTSTAEQYSDYDVSLNVYSPEIAGPERVSEEAKSAYASYAVFGVNCLVGILTESTVFDFSQQEYRLSYADHAVGTIDAASRVIDSKKELIHDFLQIRKHITTNGESQLVDATELGPLGTLWFQGALAGWSEKRANMQKVLREPIPILFQEPEWKVELDDLWDDV